MVGVSVISPEPKSRLLSPGLISNSPLLEISLESTSMFSVLLRTRVPLDFLLKFIYVIIKLFDKKHV